LKANGIAAPHGLAAIGRSNGGLLVGAVTNQSPDLFDAVSPGVGVMDMLRFDRFTAGRYWVDDYGHPDREADFRTLLTYSPYHNIKGGRAYPPLIAVTADTDDRVVPGHSFKYIAKLQSTPNVGNAPHIIRIDTRSGHGSGKPITKIIEEYSDVYAFLGNFTGLKP
jgi:prolyl oligopeptidase